jgi:hypothetical protein
MPARKAARPAIKEARAPGSAKSAPRSSKGPSHRPSTKSVSGQAKPSVSTKTLRPSKRAAAVGATYRAVCTEGDFSGGAHATREFAELEGMSHQNFPGNEAHRYTVLISTKKGKAVAAPPPGVRTIVYVHGVGNKPTEGVLRCLWDNALMDFGLGERSRMAYWRQADRHGPPSSVTCAGADVSDIPGSIDSAFGAKALMSKASLESWIDSIGQTDNERAVLRELEVELSSAGRQRTRKGSIQAQGLEDLPIPEMLLRVYTATFLQDARDFFFDNARRSAMCQSLRDRLSSAGEPFCVIGHSQGSMIAWLTLHELGTKVGHIPLLVTIGSPLSLRVVRQQLKRIAGLSKQESLPCPPSVGDWMNVYDRRDVVSLGSGIAEHVGRTGIGHHVQDVVVANTERERDAHSATGYLSTSTVRSAVRERLDIERFQQVAPFMLSADAARDFEGRSANERRPLLIELMDPTWAAAEQLRRSQDAGARPAESAAISEGLTVAAMVEALRARIHELVPHSPSRESDIDFRIMRRYVSVRLTRGEAERLAASYASELSGPRIPPVFRIWRNAKKQALLESSIHTVQAAAAHRSYDAMGQDVHWAVLDTGCTPHPHFERHGNIVAAYDCTQQTDAPIAEGTGNADTRDRFGHGTHVAGIIAGSYSVPKSTGSLREISGIAPRAKLHIYKVLNNQGVGDDAWIIKALDHIATLNESSPTPKIAGVNLSLGGPFDQDVFGCGHTPLCDELRRLSGQGVVVVLAAGNEGFARLVSEEGELGINMSYSLGDPANLEEAIAVGSVHKLKPNLYGVSHFSSRGPTADGRTKPDCVAPGEKILSCRHDHADGASSIASLYVELSGTSMAAPHVSGVLAAFLSRRTEFIGYPDRIKRILLDNCTSLGRLSDLQGAGLPNLVRMLVST